jgi:hypothetical protein
MIDYTILPKEKCVPAREGWKLPGWDTFVSVYNASDRVRETFANVNARNKRWVLVPDYSLDDASDVPANAIRANGSDELEIIKRAFDGIDSVDSGRLCIDITAFTRPQLIVALEYLRNRGVLAFDIVYTEPRYYLQGEETNFAADVVSEVRQVLGFEGDHIEESSSDALIVSVGYEDHLVTRVAGHKDHARKFRLLGFPSMQPDMYQESVIRSHRADEAIGTDRAFTFYAPAYDPFVTASVLREIVAEAEQKGAANIYMAPVSTKPQALGFALFYLFERLHTATSIIFPFTGSSARDTSRGIARVWRYEMELPPITGGANPTQLQAPVLSPRIHRAPGLR